MIYIKKILLIVLIFFTITNYSSKAFDNYLSDNKSVLVIGSYSISNSWERSVIESFTVKSSSNYKTYVEFLDSKINCCDNNNYVDEFLTLLNAKYQDKNIDYILTIDDEALYFVKDNIFNKDCIFYNKKVLGVGVNTTFIRTNEEAQYITAILDYQDNLELINIIMESNSKVKNLYLIEDNSLFCRAVRDNILSLINTYNLDIKLHYITDNIITNILPQIKEINNKDSAILLNGTFFKNNYDTKLTSDETLELIKYNTNAPIYSKLDSYIQAGAIGGVINDAERLGRLALKYIEFLSDNNTNQVIAPSANYVSIPKFNFDAVREYNINPLLLPNDSIYINKSPFELLLPQWAEIAIYSSIIVSILILIILFFLYKTNKNEALKNKTLLNESIERSNIKTDYIITISHELRTPLNIILNSSKLLTLNVESDTFDKDFYLKQLSYINKNSIRLLKLVNNLVDVSKLEIGFMDINFTNGNIVETIEEAALSTVDLAKQKNIDIIIDTEEEEIITAYDKNKIERIILNLISNAIKAINNLGEIFIHISKIDTTIIIEVIDNGHGIPENTIPYIFDKFKKGHSYETLEDRQEGSGLGLYIVKGLVNLHNGKITVESKTGIGTTFTITLPIRVVDNSTNQSKIINSNLDYQKSIEFSDLE